MATRVGGGTFTETGGVLAEPELVCAVTLGAFAEIVGVPDSRCGGEVESAGASSETDGGDGVDPWGSACSVEDTSAVEPTVSTVFVRIATGVVGSERWRVTFDESEPSSGSEGSEGSASEEGAVTETVSGAAEAVGAIGAVITNAVAVSAPNAASPMQVRGFERAIRNS